MKKVTLVILIFCVSVSAFCQEKIPFKKIESLDLLINKSQEASSNNEIYLALEYASEAVKKSHELENLDYLASSYFVLGNIYYEVIDYKTSKENLHKALEYAKKGKYKALIPSILNNLANVYYDDKKDYKNSLIYYKESVDIYKDKIAKFPDQVNMTNYETLIINLTWTYMDLREFDSSAPYLKEIDSLIFSPSGSESNKSSYYLLKARNYSHYMAIEKAEKYFDKALAKLKKEGFWPKGESYFYEYRSEMYEKNKNYLLALADKQKLLENERKVYDFAKTKQQEMAKSRFKLDEYEAKLEAHNREKKLLQNIDSYNKKIIYISLVGLVLLMIAVFFYYKAYKSKKRNTEILKSKNIALSEANEKAEKLSKIKSQFISTISHELRTPLYGVVGISSLLLENSEESANDRNLLYSLKFSADYLLNLVNKVLNISKIDSKKTELTNTPTDLLALSKNVIQSFEFQSNEKSNELLFEYDEKIPHLIEVDTLRISEIFINLIGNAIKFTEKGKIWLRVKLVSLNSETTTIRFEIQDTGIGIPIDQQGHIFEEFSQIGTIYENKQGTGLGLSIVKNLLQTMNSKIDFKSRKDVGSTFFFELELAISKNQNTMEDINKASETSEKHESSTSTPARILVAEDNKINQIVTKKLLKSIGYDGFIAENGQEAADMIKSESYDLVLMDINMPVLDGMQATIKIREFDQETPIIALTAAELSEVEEECKNAGMNDLINKPLNKEDLKIAIERNLR